MNKLLVLSWVCLAFLFASARIAADTAENEAPLMLALNLKDGSRIVGMPQREVVLVRGPYFGIAAVHLGRVESMEFKDEGETVKIAFKNGDQLTGTVSLDALSLRTLLGDLSIPIEHILSLQSARAAHLPPSIAGFRGRSGLLCGNPGVTFFDDVKIATDTGQVLFQDDFEDGNLDGWWAGFSHDPRSIRSQVIFGDERVDVWWLGFTHVPPAPGEMRRGRYSYGKWRVEGGKLVQDFLPDYTMALVNEGEFSDQVIETRFQTQGNAYAGIVLWYRDVNNWVCVNVYPTLAKISVHPNIDGSAYVDGRLWHGRGSFAYPFVSARDTWYHLKVEADGDTGTLTVYINGEKVFTYDLSSRLRSNEPFPGEGAKAYH